MNSFFTRLSLLLVAWTALCFIAQVPQTKELGFDLSRIAGYQISRVLQTSGGAFGGLVASLATCSAYGGTQFICALDTRVGNEVDYMDLNISFTCALTTQDSTQFDFRRASCYDCQVLLTSSNPSRIPKYCPCNICPLNFGSSSVSIDCSSYIPYANVTAPTAASPSVASPSVASPSVASPSVASPTVAIPTVGAVPTMAVPTMMSIPTIGGATTNTSSSGGFVPTIGGATTNSSIGGGFMPVPTSVAAPMNRSRLLQTRSRTLTVLDPYIFDTCVSVDCDGNCNGTCSLGCDDPTAAQNCAYCQTSNHTFQPTLAPTRYPTFQPTLAPTGYPNTSQPTLAPTEFITPGIPTILPTMAPVGGGGSDTGGANGVPTIQPTLAPTENATDMGTNGTPPTSNNKTSSGFLEMWPSSPRVAGMTTFLMTLIGLLKI